MHIVAAPSTTSIKRLIHNHEVKLDHVHLVITTYEAMSSPFVQNPVSV
jgi:hypothetical protein